MPTLYVVLYHISTFMRIVAVKFENMNDHANKPDMNAEDLDLAARQLARRLGCLNVRSEPYHPIPGLTLITGRWPTVDPEQTNDHQQIVIAPCVANQFCNMAQWCDLIRATSAASAHLILFVPAHHVVAAKCLLSHIGSDSGSASVWSTGSKEQYAFEN